MTSVAVMTVVMVEIVRRDSRSVLMEDVFTLTGPVRTTELETIQLDISKTELECYILNFLICLV